MLRLRSRAENVIDLEHVFSLSPCHTFRSCPGTLYITDRYRVSDELGRGRRTCLDFWNIVVRVEWVRKLASLASEPDSFWLGSLNILRQ